MIKVVFVRRTPGETWLNNIKTYWVANRGRGEIWNFKHCYIIAGNKEITNRHDTPIEQLSEEELANALDTSKNELAVIELPVSAEWIIRKRLSIRHKYWVNKRGYARTWEHHFNPLAFTGVAYTCSNMVGKLLGWNDFYALEPDDIYNRLTAK